MILLFCKKKWILGFTIHSCGSLTRFSFFFVSKTRLYVKNVHYVWMWQRCCQASKQAGLEYRRRGETTKFPLSTSVGKFATTTLHCTATRVRTTRTLLAKEVLEIEWKRWKCSRRSFFQWTTKLGLFVTFWSMVVIK